MPQFDPSSFASQLFWLAVFFTILYLLMSRVALPRIGQILEERSERISSDLDKAEALKRDAQAMVDDYEAALAKARSDAAAALSQAKADIAKTTSTREADLNARLGKRLEEAESRIAAERDAVKGELSAIATEAAQAITERLTGVRPEAGAAANAVGAELNTAR